MSHVVKKISFTPPMNKNIFYFLDSIPDIVCLKDKNGAWLWANAADLRLFGLEGVDYVGKKDSELANLAHPVFRSALLTCEQTDELAWQRAELTIAEETIDLPNGEQLIFETYKLPLFDETGERQALFVLGRDITRLKSLITALEHQTQEQEVLMSISKVWHDTSLSLQLKMEHILKLIISIPWLPLASKAAWFLAVPERNELDLAAAINFEPEHEAACKRLRYRECLCGRAVEFQKTQYIPHDKESSTDRCLIQQKHFHYIIPIRSTFNLPDMQGGFLGCLSLYTFSQPEEPERFSAFFDAVASVIAMGLETAQLSQRLLDRLAELQLAAEMLSLGVIKYNAKTKVMRWSSHVYTILKLDPENTRPSLKNYLKRVCVIDRPYVASMFRSLLKEGRPVDIRHALRFDGGEQRIVHLKISTIEKDGGLSFYGILQDIHLDVAMEEQLSLLVTILEKSKEAVVVTDKDNRILSVNKAFTEITGYSPEEVIGKGPNVLKSGYHNRSFYEEMWNSLQTTDHWEGEIWNRHKDGHTYPEWISIYVIRDKDGKPYRHISLFHEITKEKEAEALLEYQENYDTLTDLPNKTLFRDRIRTAIAKRDEDAVVAVIVLDIDDFKRANDSLGYTKGDMIIQDVASRFVQLLPHNVAISRLGGDEFGVVQACFSEQDVLSLLSMLQKAFEAPFGVDDLHLTASIGVSMAPTDGMEPDELIQKAETAMYAAKNAGKSQYVFFRKELSDSLERLLNMERLLRQAIETDSQEISLVYQPKIDLKTERIVSVEALVRWRSSALGFVSPAEFIPVAEATKLIGPLGRLILKRAASQALEWKNQGYDLTVAFNLSPVQFKAKGMVQDVFDIIEEVGVPPSSMEIEITEGAVLENEEEAIRILQQFKQRGMRIAMDDFGMGYSSLYYLKRLPIDSLKIDMVFIKELPHDKESCAITKAVISMAKAMGLKTVAEGAETQEAVDFVKAHECDMVQGYFFSPPVPAERLTQMLEQQGR